MMQTAAASGPKLLEVNNIKVSFGNRSRNLLGGAPRFITAVDGVSFDIQSGEVVSLVGESGSGKTTIGRAILGLTPVTSGRVAFAGIDLASLSPTAMKPIRRRMQVVFQDPYASLHPRYRIGRILEEPMLIQKTGNSAANFAKARELLELVGLPASAVDRFPHQFSGGQRQRIAIARALALDPELVIADEAVSALDVSIKAQVLNLLKRLQRERNLAMLLISHDLAVVRQISDRVIVMYAGQLVETAPAEMLFSKPLHPYTMALISAVPRFGAASASSRPRIVLEGEPANAVNPPSGCRFHTRCWLRKQLSNPTECVEQPPHPRELAAGHLTACHFAELLIAQSKPPRDPV